MKKYLSLLAVAALLLPLACNKNDKNEVVDLKQAPVTSSAAFKYDLGDPNVPPAEGDEVFTGVENTDDGEMILTTEDHAYSGVCQDKGNNTFMMKDEASSKEFEVTIQELKGGPAYSVTIKSNGKTFTASATPVAPITTNPTLVKAMGRKWNVLQTTISVTGGKFTSKLGAARAFNGCDLKEIADYLADAGLQLDYNFEGYKVTTIEFSQRGTIEVKFSQAKTYKGDWTVDSVGAFGYDLDIKDEKENPLFNGKALGKASVDFAKGRVNVEVSASGQDKNKENYAALVQFLLSPAK